MNILKDKKIDSIISLLRNDRKHRLYIQGTWGSFAPLLAANIQKCVNRPILYIRAHIDDAEKCADDLQTFDAQNLMVFNACENLETIADATDEIQNSRIKVMLNIDNIKSFMIPASIQSLCQPVPAKNELEKNSITLQTTKQFDPETICSWLVDNEFENVERIDLPGQFAQRGGIIDIYAPLVTVTNTTKLKDAKAGDYTQNISSEQIAEAAIRVEFFGDEIESIRLINIDSQRSTGNIDSINIISGISAVSQQDDLFTNMLPDDTIVIAEDMINIQETAQIYLSRVGDSAKLFTFEQVAKSLDRFTQVHISRFGSSSNDETKLEISSTQKYQHTSANAFDSHKETLDELSAEASKGKKVTVYCESSAQIKRLTEIIEQGQKDWPGNLKLVKGYISQGFIMESLNMVFIPHHEIFSQLTIRRSSKPLRPSAPINTLSDLNAGDYVVHASYGIGKYLGIKTIDQSGQKSEYLSIEYDNKEIVHVSVSNINLVQKFIGSSPGRPKLSKVGSKRWEKQKAKVARSVEDMAEHLLEMQAQREFAGGFECATDSKWQKEFEESFPYQETTDQVTAIEQIKGDMEKAIAMDRLLCGDVGYGKTEIAMRAAFKAISNGKQVAVLAPTTILSVQHEHTFRERFADFPVTVEVLNRFKTKRESSDIIDRAKAGKVDILIGTHRLFSGDIGFKDLGLLVIDEEQKFGVAHKEKLKSLRVNVDVLTMTATPIPRTLHMSLLGLRDISSLMTAPLDRRSVVTNVSAYRDSLIKKAILSELARDGQVFFLHNRVKSIERIAFEIGRLVKDAKARIAIAHGQMSKSELEKTMVDFVDGRIDVLICTTIIESGLDIPNANTIIIDNADRFGLAELHQLRGRVGRCKHRAYAYMLLPKNRSVTPIAAKRLKAIEDYAHLGAGFKIALRDLEIRGAGNILGAEQSGHIQLVGYQMYCELLAGAVARLKDTGEAKEHLKSFVDIGGSFYIPKNYISSDRGRMEAYRKIATVRSIEQLDDIKAELEDVYGQCPAEVEMLIDISRLRIGAAQKGIRSVTISGDAIVFVFAKTVGERQKALFAKVYGQVNVVEGKTVYFKLSKNYFEHNTLMIVLSKILNQ